MGQTLTHGVYLPDEGERNCYNGLAANWQLLDTSVGTIAEHTSALSGKAPLVHTHGNLTNDGKVGTAANKPLITGTGGVVQAGSFGNAANTFCEGNDSRLSDARTPLSHTHTKSDITDFPVYGTTAGTICEGNDSRLSDARTPVAHTHTKSDVTDLLNSNFIPSANNSYDLGSSSYQWNNLYAKNYYYNGVAWGLDKANVWGAWQTQEHATEPLIRLRRPNLQIGDPIPASQQIIGTIPFADKNNLNLGLIACRDNTDGNTYLTLITRQRYDSNGNRANNGNQYEAGINLGVDSSKNLYLIPNSNGNINLGTSTNKWKTLNGVNPGALSLPDSSNAISVDTTNWSLTGARNSYTPSANGWFFIRVEGTSICKLNIHLKSPDNDYPTWHSWNQDTYTVLTVPAIKGVKIYVYITADLIKYCKLYPCLGNV